MRAKMQPAGWGIVPLGGKRAIGVQMLRQGRKTETAFVTISCWELSKP